MRVASINAAILAPWTSAVLPRVAIGAKVPPSNGVAGEVVEVEGPEHEVRTGLFQRIEAASPEPLGVATGVATDAPEHLAEAQGSRPISTAVLGLTRIARYELIDQIGHGSFGMVYTARDTELDREVALKILNPSHHGDDEALQRFLREARATARVAHPGIVTVYDSGRHAAANGDELAYIAMERLSGESLTQRLERAGRMPPEAAAEIARQVASALDAAHQAEVLHRDLKPDNVFLVPDPAVRAGARAKVLDFGLAKIGAGRQTGLGSVFGTPLYMSPEQCRSAGDLDARSDIYSLGCILFELLAGRTPFEGAIYVLLERHVHDPAPRVSSLVPEIPPALDALVAEMLEKEPGRRPPTMADVARRLEEVLGAAGAREEALEEVLGAAGAREEALEEALELDEAERTVLDPAERTVLDPIEDDGPQPAMTAPVPVSVMPVPVPVSVMPVPVPVPVSVMPVPVPVMPVPVSVMPVPVPEPVMPVPVSVMPVPVPVPVPVPEMPVSAPEMPVSVMPVPAPEMPVSVPVPVPAAAPAPPARRLPPAPRWESRRLVARYLALAVTVALAVGGALALMELHRGRARAGDAATATQAPR